MTDGGKSIFHRPPTSHLPSPPPPADLAVFAFVAHVKITKTAKGKSEIKWRARTNR